MAPKNSTVFSEPTMIRLLTKAAHSLPGSPNIFMIPKWRLLLTPFFLLTLRIEFCEEVTTESFFWDLWSLRTNLPMQKFEKYGF